MISEKDKDKLAELNGLTKERRTDKIRQGVKKKYRLEDEIAILRKMNKRLFDLVVELHGRDISDEVITEFKEYFNAIERIKEEVDKS